MPTSDSTIEDVDDSISQLLLRENKHFRELRRIRSSLAFRIGTTIVNSIKFPPKLLILPILLLFVGFDWGLERIGKKKFNQDSFDTINTNNRNCVVMFPTNGVGFGHFTRLLAIAKRMKEKDPELEIVFFSTMSTMHLLKEHGIIGYRIPGRKEYQDTTTTSWNAILEESLSLVFAAHKPRLFVFDGAFPYRGMLNTIKERKNLVKVWVRRGTFKKKATSIPKDSLNHFDHIVRPKDSITSDVSKEILHGLEVSYCNPIILCGSNELITKKMARTRLGLGEGMFVVYIQLGAGNINNIDNVISNCIGILNSKKNIQIVIGESMIGSRLELDGKQLQILRDYPNSMYFNAFDFAIIAGGYNSYHEVIHHNLPSICIPNTKTGMDDQLARANAAASQNAMIVIEEPSKNNLSAAIEQALNPEMRSTMKLAMEKLALPNGATEAADFFNKLITD